MIQNHPTHSLSLLILNKISMHNKEVGWLVFFLQEKMKPDPFSGFFAWSLVTDHADHMIHSI
jgi:hypothetical protein